MVLRYPGASWDPLGAQTEPKMASHDIICLHTMVGSLAGTSSMFHANGYGGTESTFGVGESKAQGVKQWQDAMYQADANYEGNPRVTSVETADYGGIFGKWNTNDASQVPAWTAEQLDMIVGIIVWYCRKSTHANCPSTWACHQSGVPCVLIPDTKPGRRGVGFHRQGCKPNVVAGGEVWSVSYGKICPGSRREAQLKTIVIPRAQKILAGVVTPPPPEEPTLSGFTAEQLFAIDYNANAKYGSDLWAAPTGTGTALIRTVNNIAAALVVVSNKVDALSKQMIAEDQIDDAAFAAAMNEVNSSLAALKNALPPAEIEVPKA